MPGRAHTGFAGQETRACADFGNLCTRWAMGYCLSVGVPSNSGPVMNQPALSTLRRWPRYKLDLPVRVIAEKGSKTTIVQGRGNELNEGGLALFVGMELAIGQHVSVEFTPPYSGQPMRARAIVRNRSGYTYGVEFMMESNEDIGNASQIRSVLRGFAAAIQ